MVQIKWLQSAKNDLREIYDYISKDSKRYAQLQVEKIRTRTEILKNQIEIGKVVVELENENIKELIEGNYRIIYRITSKHEIHILMIQHGARDLSRRIEFGV